MSENIFLCLLFVNIVFCYDYLHLNPNDRSRMVNYKTEDRADDGEVANINVASLFQGSDDDKVENQFEADDSRDFSNSNFDSLVEANLEEYQGNEDYMNSDVNDDSLFDEKPQIYSNDRLLDNVNRKDTQRYDNFHTQNEYKNLQKKCVFKNMKIPFFSHEKRKTTQTKKNKKRKLFNFASKKVKGKANTVTTSLDLTTHRSTESTLFKLNKRSYSERICPICRRKFRATRAKSNEQSSLIHNSRQFYNRNPFNNVPGNDFKLRQSEDAEPEETIRDSTLSRELNPERR